MIQLVMPELSENQKIQIIQDSRKFTKKWKTLTREGKIQILSGMDIATDYKWMLTIFEEAKGEDIIIT